MVVYKTRNWNWKLHVSVYAGYWLLRILDIYHSCPVTQLPITATVHHHYQLLLRTTHFHCTTHMCNHRPSSYRHITTKCHITTHMQETKNKIYHTIEYILLPNEIETTIKTYYRIKYIINNYDKLQFI